MIFVVETSQRQSRNPADDAADLGQRIAAFASESKWTVATAESLTGGNVSAQLSAIEGASDWFRGAVVAYAEAVKFELLGVEHGPVITADAARQMAVGVLALLRADFAVSTTGVGGPGPQEGRPEGTVFIAVATPRGSEVTEYHFDGEPGAIVEQATRQALHDLGRTATRFAASSRVDPVNQ